MSVVVAAWGGGVNSTAMLVEWLRLGERLDIVLFADTGGEKPETYVYRDTFAAWFKTKSGAPFITVKANNRDESLEAECLRSKTLPSIAYRGKKRCSQKWKRQPQDIFCNNWEPTLQAWARGEKVTKLIGYDAGERHRAMNARIDPKYEYRHPLIEWGWSRKDCITAIIAAGLNQPPKSACFFCPSSKESEILALKETHPDLLQRALAIEANATVREGYGWVTGLMGKKKWSDLLERDRRQGTLFPDPPTIPCDCFDGDDEG